VILYEYPFNERIRSYLRLEHLFQRFWILSNRENSIDHHFALVTIFEIMDVGARADLKSDVLKDLDRQKNALNSYRGNPAGQILTENDWLMAIRSRSGIPGGTCSFDLPSYHAWQHQSTHLRQQRLHQWGEVFTPLAESIALLLGMLRDAGTPQKIMAIDGQFQQLLPQGRSFQLMRIFLDNSLSLIPEISGNRMMVSVRLMEKDSNDRMMQYKNDVVLEMSLCG
jgi:cell division protein ZapD